MKRALALIVSGAAAAAAAATAWLLSGDEEGEPAAPVALPPPPENDSSSTGGGGGSGITMNENEIEALARVIASEAGSGTLAEQRGIAWTVRNRFRGKSIYAVQYPWRSQKGGNPPFASDETPKESHRKLAREVLAADQSQDPTGGATSFFEPRMQNAFAKAGALARAGETGDRVIDGVKLTDITRFKAYKKDADEIRASWGKSSAVYATAGRFEFWGSARLLAKKGNPAPRVLVGELDMLGAEWATG